MVLISHFDRYWCFVFLFKKKFQRLTMFNVKIRFNKIATNSMNTLRIWTFYYFLIHSSVLFSHSLYSVVDWKPKNKWIQYLIKRKINSAGSYQYYCWVFIPFMHKSVYNNCHVFSIIFYCKQTHHSWNRFISHFKCKTRRQTWNWANSRWNTPISTKSIIQGVPCDCVSP